MDKGLLENSDFLDHYDKIAKLFIKYNPNIKQIIEFTELVEPEKKSFDTETDQLKSFNEQIEETRRNYEASGSVLLSLRQEKGDKDSVNELADTLESYHPEVEVKPLSELVMEMNDVSPEEGTLLDEASSIETEDLSNTAVIDIITDEMIQKELEKEAESGLFGSIIDIIKKK